MKRPCALVVDGGAALAEDLEHGLAVVPQRILVDGVEFIDDGRTGAYASFYRRLRDGETTLTSTPAPGAYLDAYRRCDAGAIVCLTIPAQWSGMYDAAVV